MMTGQRPNFVPPRGTLRRRMLISLTVLAGLIFVSSILLFWQLRMLREAIRDLQEEAAFLGSVLETSQQVTSLILVAQDEADEQISDQFSERMSAEVHDLELKQEELMAQVVDLPADDPIRVLVEEVITLQNIAIDIADRTIRSAQDGDWTEVQLGVGVLSVSYSKVQWNVDRLLARAQDERARAEIQASQTMVRAASISIVVVVVSLIGAAVVFFTTIHNVIIRVGRLDRMALRLAEGQLDEHTTQIIADQSYSEDELGSLAHSINTMAVRLKETIDTLEERVAERTAALARRGVQLETSARIAREAAAILDVDRLMDTTVRLISERFSFYHAGIFLLDERGAYAVLQAASSDGGQRMLAKGHQLKVSEVGIVGYAAGTGKPRIALDVGADAVFFDNPDLPDTRSEVALPLVVGERVIGVLDVQSTEEAAFSDEDVAMLQTMADQVALAIEHARLLEESRRALRELEAIYGRRVREAWGERAARQSMSYRYTGLGVKPVPDPVLAEMESIPFERWPVVLQEEDGRRLVAPIRLRGQTLGSVVLRQDAEGEPWSEDDVALVEELVTQVGLALENARLLEETRRRAEWEQSLSQLTARFSRSLDLDTMLQTAVRELGQLPNVAEVSVHVGVPEEQPAVGQHDERVETDQAADGPLVSEQL